MKTFLIVILACSSVFSQVADDDRFYNQVLQGNRIFVVVNVESQDYSGKGIVENAMLYSMFARTRNFNKEKYIEFMKTILKDGGTLKIKRDDLKRMKFMKFEQVPEVEVVSAKGEVVFLNHYFEGDYSAKPVTRAIRPAIVERLWYWRTLSWVDDISGLLRKYKPSGG